MLEQNEFKGTARFLIQDRLGEGGFGVVYRAFDNDKRTVIALKTLRDVGADNLYQFKREFRALADIIHPNLASLFELFSEDKQWFFTMELIEGVNFLDYIWENFSSPQSRLEEIKHLEHTTVKHQPVVTSPDSNEFSDVMFYNRRSLNVVKLNTTRLRSVMIQLVEGINALHQANKLHRDIKPSNVLVTHDGLVKILDFGLVREILDPQRNESDNSLVGTPLYMSPEQAACKPVCEATDWYSVGVILYEALTGQFPHEGKLIEVLRKKQMSDPTPPSEINPKVPEDLNLLCMELLQRKPEKRPTGPEILRRLYDQQKIVVVGNDDAIDSAIPQRVSFIGREEEFEQLKNAFHEAKVGKSIAVFVQGYSGMGKSALIREFLNELQAQESDLLLLSGRCYKQESVPYKVFDDVIDILSIYLKQLSEKKSLPNMPAELSLLARLFPVFNQVTEIESGHGEIVTMPSSQELRKRAFKAFRNLLDRLGHEKMVVIFIDDLQWGDLDSASLLAEILRTPNAPRLLLIGSYRSEEVETSLFLKSLFSLQNRDEKIDFCNISVEALSPAQSIRLARSLLSDSSPNQIDTIVEEADGSPFFIGELARFALSQKNHHIEAKSIEMTIDKVISARIAQLPEDGRRLLEIVSIAGQPLERNIALQAAELEIDEQVLQLLKVAHLLRLTSSDYEELDTYHDRIREAVTATLSEESIKRYHHNLAVTLEHTNPSDPERLAKHFHNAGELQKAYDFTIAAAEKAAEAVAFDRVARLYKQALELGVADAKTACSLNIKLGDALANGGRGAEAAKAYITAANGVTALEKVELLRRAAEQLLISGHIDEGLSEINRVLGMMDLKLASNTFTALISLLNNRLKLWLRGTKFQQRDQSQISPRDLMLIDLCWSAVKGLSMVDTMRSSAFQTFHLLLALKVGEPFRIVRALNAEVCYWYAAGGRQKSFALKLFAEAHAIAKGINNPYLFELLTLTDGFMSFQEGRWAESLQKLEQIEVVLREHSAGIAWEIDNARVYTLINIYYLGELKELSQRLPILLKEAVDRGDLYCEIYMRTSVQYMTYLAKDEPERATQKLDQAIKLWSQQGFYLQHFHVLISEIQIALYCGNGEQAWRNINEKWRDVKRSFLMEVRIILLEALYLRARSALAMALKGIDTGSMLSLALRDAKRMERENMAYGNGWACLIRASIAVLRKKISEAIRLLTLAEKDFQSVNMSLYVAGARRCRGQLIGGVEGEKLVDLADSWMSEQLIKNPVRMTQMIIPGNWE